MTATTATAVRHPSAVSATEIVAALAFQAGLAHLLSRATKAATRRENADLAVAVPAQRTA